MYGLFDYGDNHGDGGWGNLESYSDHCIIMLGSSTGDPRILTQGFASARHYRDLYAQGRRGMTMDNAKKAERKADRYRSKSAIARSVISSNRSKISATKRTNQTLESEIRQMEKVFWLLSIYRVKWLPNFQPVQLRQALGM